MNKLKGCVLCRFLCVGLSLLMLFSTVPVFAVVSSPFDDTTLETLTDAEDFNFVGNTPELRALGGFYAAQKDWLFYADWTQNGVLCAANADGTQKLTLTDYPVANINVAGDMLVFTDISATVSRSYAADRKLANDKLTYGGVLYQAEGVKALMSGGKLGEIRQVGGDAAYYHVNLGENTIYALSGTADGEHFGTDWSYVQVLDDEVSTLFSASDGERIVNFVDNYLVEYFEVESSEEWGYILRRDPVGGQLIDTLPGRELSVFGERIFFISNTNHYLYELKSNTAELTQVSASPIASYIIRDNGDIQALGPDGHIKILISLNGSYKDIGKPYPVGEWYNYFALKYALPDDSPPPPPSSSSSSQKLEGNETHTWIFDKTIVCPPGVFDPPGKTNPPGTVDPPKSPTITIPPENDLMPPEVAVEMVMLLIKCKDSSEPLFKQYYSPSQREAFDTYFANTFDERWSDFENSLNEMIDAPGDGMFNEAHKKKLLGILQNCLQQIQYTLKTVQQTDETATVHLYLTQTINFDFGESFTTGAFALSLHNYLKKNGLDMSYLRSLSNQDEVLDFLLDFMSEYLPEAMGPIQVSKTLEFHLAADSVLNWVITTPDVINQLEDSVNGGSKDIFNPENIFSKKEDPILSEKKPLENKPLVEKRVYGMGCIYKKVLFEREAPNVWEVLGRDTKQMWNDFWGIETPKYEPVDNYLETKHGLGSPLPGRNLCPEELKIIIPGKPKSTWEMVKGWFSGDDGDDLSKQ